MEARLLERRFAARSNRNLNSSSIRTGIGFVGGCLFKVTRASYTTGIRCQHPNLKLLQLFFGSYINGAVADTRPIPVRLSDEMIHRLDAAAGKLHSNRANLIRFCLDTWLDHHATHGEAVLPPDWEQLQAEYDGRRTNRDVVRSQKPVRPARSKAAPDRAGKGGPKKKK